MPAIYSEYPVCCRSAAPAEHDRIEGAGDFYQAGASCRMQWLQGVAHGVGGDDAAFAHQDLAGDQPALAVLVVDQRQPARIGVHRLVAAAREEGIDDLADAIRIT